MLDLELKKKLYVFPTVSSFWRPALLLIDCPVLFGVVYDTTQLDKTQHKIKLDKSFMIFKKIIICVMSFMAQQHIWTVYLQKD